MNTNYFVLSPGRCGSILTCYSILYSLNTFYNKEDHCQMQHVGENHFESKFKTTSTVYHCHNLRFNHVKKDDCDLLLVLRQDMFAAVLSMYIADIFNLHTIDSTVHKGNKEKFLSKLQTIDQTGIDVDTRVWQNLVIRFNKFWTYDVGSLKSFYKNVHTVYYEDFKDNIGYINQVLDIPVQDIPNNALTEKLPYNKWQLVNNKEEIVNIFLQNTNIPLSESLYTS